MESRAWRRRRISDQGFYGLLFLSSPYFRPISRCKVDKERNSWPKSPILSTKGPKFAMLFNAWPKFPILSTEKSRESRPTLVSNFNPGYPSLRHGGK